MPTKELPEDAPGKYVPYHPEPYYSPEPLPIEPKLDLPEQTRDLVADAAYQIGRVDGISSTVDFSAVLYTSLIRIEAVESARIEGADVAYQDVEAYHTRHPEGQSDPKIENDLKEALNYETALTHGLNKIESRESLTLSLLKNLHSILLEDVRNEGDVVGGFRDHMVHLSSPQPGKRPFVPPAPEGLNGLMTSFESYIQMGGQYHPLVDAAIIHYFFETVHPFSDGNGRLGRLLIIVAFVILEVGSEFAVTGNMADFVPYSVTCPPSNVPEFRGSKPERIQIVRHLPVVPNRSLVGASDDLFRHT